MTKPTFDMEAALKALREGQGLTGKDGILTPLIKQLTEAAMPAELEDHLAQEEAPNRKNGKSSKTIKSPSGNFELDTPRDRAGTFEPQLVKKHQTHLTDDLERKILVLFALGNSYQDIRGHIEDLYGIELSNGTINAVTDKLLPELQAWRELSIWRRSTLSSGWTPFTTRSKRMVVTLARPFTRFWVSLSKAKKSC